jgi:hypothetical protein
VHLFSACDEVLQLRGSGRAHVEDARTREERGSKKNATACGSEIEMLDSVIAKRADRERE